MTLSSRNPLKILCRHGEEILKQVLQVIHRLETEADPGFEFSKSVGPHLRHIMDHYDALLNAVEHHATVAFDRRQRETADQKDPQASRERLQLLIQGLQALSLSSHAPQGADLSLRVAFQAGLSGEHEVIAASTLGRELLFVNHHAVHHLALVRIYCEQAGLPMSSEFGKAPSTIAFEKQMLAVCA